MSKFDFINPRFVKTAVQAKDYPQPCGSRGCPLPEIAVIGRSNVGKSSLLNDLFQTKKLVKVSSKPGKTQTLNFFTLNDTLSFVDLPGYGYAEVPMATKMQWAPMVQTYFETRESLRLILFLFDIRRTPNEEDKTLLEWAENSRHSVVLVLTKTDKVTQSEKVRYAEKIVEAFAAEHLKVVHYSVKHNLGRNALTAIIQNDLKTWV